MSGEFAGLRLKNHGANDIAGEQVGRELDALELNAESGAEGFDEKSFCEPGHALEENVAIGEQGDEESFDGGVLTDHGFANFCAKFI
jgi:hypothetical protein